MWENVWENKCLLSDGIERKLGIKAEVRILLPRVIPNTDRLYHDVGGLKLKNKHLIATTPNKLPATTCFTPN